MAKGFILLFSLSPLLVFGGMDLNRKVESHYVEKPANVARIAETIPPEVVFVREVEIKEVVLNTEAPKDLREYARRTAIEHGLRGRDIDVFIAQLQLESNFNPKARGAAGEVGVGQIMSFNIKPEVTRNSRAQIELAAGMMSRYRSQLGSMDKALIAYNAGVSAARTGKVPASTKRYVANINKMAKK